MFPLHLLNSDFFFCCLSQRFVFERDFVITGFLSESTVLKIGGGSDQMSHCVVVAHWKFDPKAPRSWDIEAAANIQGPLHPLHLHINSLN